MATTSYDVQQDSLRQQIGIVLQEPFLFSDTVLNNLRYARLEATEADCIEAAKQANAHDFILRLPHGYDTLLTERGSNLSQGQRQLLTIARMMVPTPAWSSSMKPPATSIPAPRPKSKPPSTA
jgi:ABC-type multidrug transport system fused ATPase/permease subunit